MAVDPLTKSTVDDLFNDNLSDFDDDIFGDRPALNDTRDDKAVLSPRAGLKRKTRDDDKENNLLGIDEEVKITKTRKPVVKLDEARLLSEPGIPKLRALTRSGQLNKRLRLKGKGHEFSDAGRLLNHFQLWLDNLYPRAKFADALQLVERAGHTKRMQIIRSEWIDEGKPGYKRYEELSMGGEVSDEPDLFRTAEARPAHGTTDMHETDVKTRQANSLFGNAIGDDHDDALFIPDLNRPSQIDRDDEPDDDELDALLAIQDSGTDGPAAARSEQPDDSEGEDDLDALLAAQRARRDRPVPTANVETQAVLGSDSQNDHDTVLAEQPSKSANASSKSPVESVGDEDEDELEALLASHHSKPHPLDGSRSPEPPSLPTPQRTSSPAIESSSSQTIRAGGEVEEEQEQEEEKEEDSMPAPTLFSSSPVPNNPEELDLDDLDALLASQEARSNAAAVRT